VINSRYLSLTTYRADGSEVSTPVWVVSDNERRLLVWTGKATGKVKRVLGNPSVMVAPCTIRGRETAARVPGRAQVLPAEAMPLVVDLLRKKYGWQKKGLELFDRASRRKGESDGGSVAIEITV
jgi:PPOX class probable F420-dependent enzyme